MPLISNILNVINNLYLTNQASDPANTAGKTVVYTKTDGLYARIADGTVIGPMGAGGAASTDGWTAAGETWTYASADGPTGVFTVAADVTGKYSMGMRVKLTQTTVKYGIIVAISYGAPNTAITIYMGTDYTLASAAITSPYYSTAKYPFGFPSSPEKWSIEVTDTSDVYQSSPTPGTWYNLGSLSITVHIGAWDLSYYVTTYASKTSTSIVQYAALSTANNSASDAALKSASSGVGVASGTVTRRKILSLAAKTIYYLNASGDTSGIADINFRGDFATTIIRAVCAYL